jgi:5-methylcytosine-specific restriction endonuclease McrA
MVDMVEFELILTDGGAEDGSPKPARRGTTNGNARGGSDERRRRREWLVQTYRADRDVVVIDLFHGPVVVEVDPGTEGAEPACRCYRCGVLLTTSTVTVDRIVPGCQGGTYRRTNIRPACGRCNSQTGATTRRTKR